MALEAFKRGDEVLSKFSDGSIMTVLAVEGLKVRCSDSQNLQYWFDMMMLERYQHPQGVDEMPSTEEFAAATSDVYAAPMAMAA
jgi:hypothetical protein